MTREELFINGQAVDLPEKTGVTLKISSNLLGDIDAIAGNTTYSINLPKTERNRSVLTMADVLTTTPAVPYTKFRVEYVRNGVSIFDDAVGVLTKITDTAFVISATWGVSQALAALKEKGVTLQDIGNGESVVRKETYPASERTRYNSRAWQPYIIAEYNPYTYTPVAKPHSWWQTAGERLDITQSEESDVRTMLERYKHILPAVTAERILTNIRDTQGVNVVFDNAARAMITEDIAIPLATIACGVESATQTGTTHTATLIINTSTSALGLFPASLNAPFVVGGISPTTEALSVVDGKIAVNNDATLGVKVRLRVVIISRYTFAAGVKPATPNAIPDGDMYAALDNGTNELRMVATTLHTTYGGGAVTQIVEFTGEGVMPMESGEMLAFSLHVSATNAGTGTLFLTATTTGQACEADVSFFEMSGDCPYDYPMPVFANLPAVKVLDFIKTLCALTGTYPRLQDGDVHLTDVGAIFNACTEAGSDDWSDKVNGDAVEVSYTYGEWARKNWYRYKVNDLKAASDDASIDIESSRLDETRDIFTIPFQNGNGVHYPTTEKKVEGLTTTYDFKGGGAAIMEVYPIQDSAQTRCALRWGDSVRMSSVLNRYYFRLRKVLQHVRVIKAEVFLTDIEVQSFDDRRPVYIEQFGHYYAVLSITTGDPYASVELLEIK